MHVIRDKGAYTGDNRVVVMLLLPVRFRVIGSLEQVINAKTPAEGTEEVRKELVATVSEKMCGDDVLEYPPIEERPCGS